MTNFDYDALAEKWSDRVLHVMMKKEESREVVLEIDRWLSGTTTAADLCEVAAKEGSPRLRKYLFDGKTRVKPHSVTIVFDSKRDALAFEAWLQHEAEYYFLYGGEEEDNERKSATEMRAAADAARQIRNQSK